MFLIAGNAGVILMLGVLMKGWKGSSDPSEIAVVCFSEPGLELSDGKENSKL